MPLQITHLLLLFLLLTPLTLCQDQPQQPQPQIIDQGERTIQLQIAKRQNIGVNHQHVKVYTFHLKTQQDFILTVDSQHTIKGYVSVYWQEAGTFLESRFQPGQEVRLLIYQDRQLVIVNEIFYQTTGFTFTAKKGHQYLLRFVKSGNDKLIMLSMENYLSDSKTEEAISTDHLDSHWKRTNGIRSKMGTYLAVVEHNAYINEKIAEKVLKHTESYMVYQVVELVFVAVAILSQIFFIKKLLRRQSVI